MRHSCIVCLPCPHDVLRASSTQSECGLQIRIQHVIGVIDPLYCDFGASVLHPRSQMQHKQFNTLLNDLQARSTQPSHPSSPLTYSHKRLVDSFYPSDGHDRIRVTRDEKTGAVIDCMRKVRLGDLNVYSPKTTADWRISVNMEINGFIYVTHLRSSY